MLLAAGSPYQRAGPGNKLVVALAEADLAFDHVEAFVLAAMNVQRWPKAGGELALDQPESAPGVRRANLDLHQAALPPESVLPGVHPWSTSVHLRFPPCIAAHIDGTQAP